MAKTLEELIQQKADRLTTVPDEFLTRTQRAEKKLFTDLQELLGQLEKSEGYFVSNKKNLEIAGRIVDQMKEVFYTSEYAEAVAEFALEFDAQAELADKYFSKAFDFTGSEFGLAVVEKAKRNAVNMLLDAEANASFFEPLRDALEEAVVSGARYKDTLEVLTPFFEGEDGGKIKAYSSQIAHDVFAFSDAEYMSTVADEIGAEWFKYSGSEIDTSRPFCKERHEKYFHYKEIEGWPEGKRVDGELTPTNEGTWTGMVKGTSPQTIYTYRGGWNCRHSIVAVSILLVPKEVIQRNIKSGNFVPSEFEIKELGL